MKLVDNLKSFTVVRTTNPDELTSPWFSATRDSYDGTKEISASFDSYIDRAYKRNGIIFACIQARAMPFSEARFQYQEMTDGNPGRLFNAPGLELLNHPWPNATTGELLVRCEQEASLAGNAYYTPRGGRLRRLRPDWVTILSGIPGDPHGSPFDLDAEILAYIYQPPGKTAVLLTPEQVVHYSPIPDPDAQWRGMSWLTPVINEITADSQMTEHKLKFLKQGATLNFAIVYDKSLTADQAKAHAAVFADAHAGVANAYKTLHIGGGADAKVLSSNLKELDYKAVQGAGETRIAAAAGVGAIMARFSEGMQGSSLNQGNYESAKRQFGDMTLRPLWRMAAGSFEKITSPPNDARLWYDARDVEFLKADRKDAAEIQQLQAITNAALVQAGYVPASVIDAVESNDFTRLTHSGLYSVQLQTPGGSDPTAPLPPLELAGLLQKIYLAVTANVISAPEAREIANRAGAGLTGAPPAA